MVLAPPAARAVIYPTLQPDTMYERHREVLLGEVTNIRAGGEELTITLQAVCKGTRQVGDRLVIAAQGDVRKSAAALVASGDLKLGAKWVGFAAPANRATPDAFTFFMASTNGIGAISATEPWRWERQDTGPGGGAEVPTLAGVWCGSIDQLWQLVLDIRDGRDYFPRYAYCRFQPDQLLLQLDKPARGVALYDLDGDGDLDLYLCTAAGDEVLLQVKPQDGKPTFRRATAYVGLPGLASRSVSVADANADGRADLLVDGRLLLAGPRVKDRFAAASTLLPTSAADKVHSCAFVELNGDGFPDVVVSQVGGGLRAYRNQGPDQAMLDVTAAMGLDAPACGAGGTGYFAAADVNGDGRDDLFYGAARGLLLVQDAGGRFVAQRGLEHVNLLSGRADTPGATGGAVFGPFLGPTLSDLIIPTEQNWLVLANASGKFVDVTAFGGEITEGSISHLASVAGDFDVDGHADFYTFSHARNGHNRLLLNRGYGMFMHADKHRRYDALFVGEAHQSGGQGGPSAT
jgi:hypothetical protein